MEKDGTCKGTLTIIPTTEGKNVQELVKRGKLGISTRGFGTVTEKSKVVDGKTIKFNDVNDDFRLVNPGDFVISASVEGAGNIAEGIYLLEFELNKGLDLNLEKSEGDKMKRDPLEEEIRTNLIVNYHTAKKEKGFKGTFEEWKWTDKNEILTRAAVSFEAGKYASIEEALEDLGAPEIAEQNMIEVNKIDPWKYANEAILAGVSPEEYASRINACIGETVKSVATGWSDEERKVILENAELAGFDLSTAEKRLKVLNEHPVFEPDDEDSLLEKEANKIHKKLNESGTVVSLDTVRTGLIKEQEKKRAEEAKQARIQSMVRESLLAGAVIRPKETK